MNKWLILLENWHRIYCEHWIIAIFLSIISKWKFHLWVVYSPDVDPVMKWNVQCPVHFTMPFVHWHRFPLWFGAIFWDWWMNQSIHQANVTINNPWLSCGFCCDSLQSVRVFGGCTNMSIHAPPTIILKNCCILVAQCSAQMPGDA